MYVLGTVLTFPNKKTPPYLLTTWLCKIFSCHDYASNLTSFLEIWQCYPIYILVNHGMPLYYVTQNENVCQLTVPFMSAFCTLDKSLTGHQHSAIRHFCVTSRLNMFIVWQMALILHTLVNQTLIFFAAVTSTR